MKKPLIMLMLSVFLLISAFADENIVYVNDGGTGDGSSVSTPIGTLADAYELLGDNGGRIVITDKLTLASKFVEPAHAGKITITGGTLAVNDIRFILNGATLFENINLQGEGQYLNIVAQFNPIVFGDGITVSGFGDFSGVTKGICIIGGVQSGEDKYNDSTLIDKDANITVKSGKALIIGSSRSVSKAFTGTVNMTLEGGTFYNIYMGTANKGSSGNVNINISGGTFLYNIFSNAKISKVAGNINVRIIGGDFSATTILRFDGSVSGEGTTSVADVRELKNYSTVVEKMEGFTKIITDEGEIIPSEQVAANDAFLYGSFTASDGTVLPYRYYLPEDYETSGKDYPIFLYMHGNGSRGSNNTSQLTSTGTPLNSAVFESKYDCIMLAPQCPSKTEWTLNGTIGNVNTYPGSEEYAKFLESGEAYPGNYFCAAAELLDMFLTDYNVDTSRVYIHGTSNGGGAVWNMLALYPEVFAAAVPVAGSLATEEYAHSVAHRMKDVAIWAFHGDADASVPVESTRVLVNAIEEVGGNVKYTEVEGGTHGNIWKITAQTPGIIDWIFEQTNDSFENTISKEKGDALAAPTNLRWNMNIATWDTVENAGAYKVTVYVGDNAAKTVFTNNNYYVPQLESFEQGYGTCISFKECL